MSDPWEVFECAFGGDTFSELFRQRGQTPFGYGGHFVASMLEVAQDGANVDRS